MTVTEIDRYAELHREEAIAFLAEMLQTPSPTGEELAISQVAERWMTEDGFEVKRWCMAPNRPNLVVDWVGDPTGPKFLFNGHYDVFPPAEDSKTPWSGDIREGNIYGCGSVDMKGGLCAGIMAAKLLKRSGFVPNGTVTISCDCDEEQGGEYGVKYLLSQGLLKADFGVCMEASERWVIVDSDGRIAYRITYRADSWHAGMRADHMDALQKAHQAMTRLYQYDEALKKERYYGADDGGAILSVTEIQAGGNGEESNIHPSICTISLDRRYTRGETIESATKELRDLLDELKHQNPQMEYELETLIASPKLEVDATSRCVQSAINSYKAVTGKTVTPGRRCGGGDTAKITSAYGFPLPQFGPGKFDQLCTVNEHLSVDEYMDFVKIYMNMVIDLLG